MNTVAMKPVIILAFLATTLFAQTFEVASVKKSPDSPGDLIYINLGKIDHETLTLSNASLSDIIRFAYSLTSNRQLAGPDWITSKLVRYDVVAKTAPNTPREQALKMLQALLAERFKLAFHYEKRELPYYALVVGKNGAKLHAATDEPATAPKDAQGQLRIVSNSIPMLMVATLLSRYMGDFVVDETGLPGRFEVKLVWTPDDRPVPDDQRGPSVFTAVQEQLGLKLEPRKGPMDVMIIDHAEKTPLEN